MSSNVHALKQTVDEAAETPPTAEAPSTESMVTETESVADDPRRELRDLINGEQASCTRVDALLKGIERAEETAAAADAEVEKCEAAVEKAKEQDGIAAANAQLKGKTPKQGSTRQARNELLEAEDAAEVAHTAVQKLREKLPELHEEMKWCQVRILTATNKLLQPLIAGLNARIIENQHKINADLLMLFVLCEADETPSLEHGQWHAEKQIAEPIAEVTAEAKETLSGRGLAESDFDARERTKDDIRAMLDRLLEDASAPLPEI